MREHFEGSKKCLSADSELQIPPVIVLILGRKGQNPVTSVRHVSPGTSKQDKRFHILFYLHSKQWFLK